MKAAWIVLGALVACQPFNALIEPGARIEAQPVASASASPTPSAGPSKPAPAARPSQAAVPGRGGPRAAIPSQPRTVVGEVIVSEGSPPPPDAIDVQREETP